jgi:hypothetical protein
MQTFLTKKKRDWSEGVHANTKSQTAIQRTSSKAHRHAAKYRVAWNALKELAPLVPQKPAAKGWQERFQLLEDADIRGLPTDALNVEESEGRRALSWIWIAFASVADDEPGMIDG